MKHTTLDPKAAAQQAIPSVRALARVLGNATRWQLLAELSVGEPLRVVQLAKAVDEKPDLVSKHLKVMRSARITVLGKNGLHRIADRFMPAAGVREIDLGHCIIRLAEPVVAGKGYT
jgi:DNA-binding transcriptional ArsR family regulator